MNKTPGRVRFAGITFISLAAVLAGCGDDADPSAAFVGSWMYTSGMGNITCAPLPAMSLPWSGTLTFAKGADGTLEVTKAIGDQMCVIKLNVAGGTATAVPGQSCMVGATVMGTTVTATLRVDTFSFTLAGDTITEAGSGTATPMGFPIPLTCAFSSMGQLTKAP